MSIACPPFAPIVLLTDDAKLAAALSCAMGVRGAYLPVFDGPRMGRADAENEVIRRNNAVLRSGAGRVLMAGVTEAGEAAMRAAYPNRFNENATWDNVEALVDDPARLAAPRLRWGRDRLGVGVLKALYGRQLLELVDEDSPVEDVPSKSGHLVVCEAGDPICEVIAANYAFALGAGLHVFDPVAEPEAEELLEILYSIDEAGRDPPALRARIKRRFRELCGDFALPPQGSLTFVTKKLPIGFAFPEIPSTHLFSYPDIGIAIANGFAAEQKKTRGTNVAVAVDPGEVSAAEIDAAAKALPERTIFLRVHAQAGATVREVTDLVALFPYDLLIFATHCGDAGGYRETYEYRDSEGIERRLVVDIAVGFGQADDPDIVQVQQYIRFHSLDGVDWTDTEAKRNLHVGQAIHDFLAQSRAGEIEPIDRVEIGRVAGSAALAMHGSNYLFAEHVIACHTTPIIINNACASWHQLAGRFTWAGARAYIGTLFPVSDGEAQENVVRLLDKYFGKPLGQAVWSAQNDVYGPDSDRRPYVVTGVYPQRLRATKEDVPRRLFRILQREFARLDRRLEELPAGGDENLGRRIASERAYYNREAAGLRARYMPK